MNLCVEKRTNILCKYIEDKIKECKYYYVVELPISAYRVHDLNEFNCNYIKLKLISKLKKL